MKYHRIILFILLSNAVVDSAAIGACETNGTVTFSKSTLSDCLKKNILKEKERCLTERFGAAFQFKASDKETLVMTTKESFCIDSFFVESKKRTVTASFDKDGHPIGVSNFSTPIDTGRISFANDICGWGPTGSFQPKLSPNFSFISPSSKIKVAFPGCRPDGTLNPGIVALVSRTTICSTPLNANTSFGYGADGHYHFTALNNGMMKDGDQSIKIVKGKDYRNANPAEYPCKWRETPADVLKSFAEEHSE